MQCSNCGRSINPDESSNPCPECGSLDRNVFIEEKLKMVEMLKLKAKGSEGNTLLERKRGEKVSKHGRIAHEFLEYDHRDSEKTIKTHLIEEQKGDDKWEIVHEEYEEYPAKRRPNQVGD